MIPDREVVADLVRFYGDRGEIQSNGETFTVYIRLPESNDTLVGTLTKSGEFISDLGQIAAPEEYVRFGVTLCETYAAALGPNYMLDKGALIELRSRIDRLIK